MKRYSLALWTAALCAIALACGDDDDGQTRRDASTRDGGASSDASTTDGGARDGSVSRECDADDAGLTLPMGFCAMTFADDVGRARQLTVTPNGDVYVAVNDARDGSDLGEILALRDENGDGRADRIERFHDRGGNDVVWRDGQLWFAENARIVRFDVSMDLVPSQPPVVIVGGLPAMGDHVTKSIVLDGDDLYVSIGSASNSCQVENRELESPGVDPCPELAVRAGVWLFDADMPGQTQMDGERFVSGTRNLVAIERHPENGDLYAVNNGRDQLFENWPDLYTMEDDEVLPAEELFRLREGEQYGWPYCYFDPRMEMLVLAPEYGGDQSAPGRCALLSGPITDYPAHWAPLGMHFYRGSMFPEHYREGVFIAFHGSRFSPMAMGDLPGYNVIFQPFDGDLPTNGFEEFADGFAGKGRPLPEMAEHRPVGLAEGPDGSLFITDDHGGRIYRVFYTGE
jgi:glucose/arabinose dehydrogenase